MSLLQDVHILNPWNLNMLGCIAEENQGGKSLDFKLGRLS
jgi:hypothetical protein